MLPQEKGGKEGKHYRVGLCISDLGKKPYYLSK